MNYDYSYGNKFYKFDLNNCEGLNCKKYTIIAPSQEQNGTVGIEKIMCPRPIFDDYNYVGSGKLTGKVAIITGADKCSW